MEIDGGVNALRGFRKQFLYSLYRIITSKNNEIFYPEGIEDLDIYNSNNELIESVQVKDYKNNLNFSKLEELFLRASNTIKEYSNIKIILASYGDIGQELKTAINSNEEVLKKQKKFNKPHILLVFRHLKFEKLDEEEQYEKIKAYLNNNPIITGNWKYAFDILMNDLYIGAEKREKFTYQNIKNRVQQIGKYLTEREAHHKEWGVSIIALENHENIDVDESKLRKYFYEGGAAKWKHISKNLDIVRDKYLEKIKNGFQKHSIVIIHGASGQGKSTLAYRYLNNYCPSSTRYEILDLSTSKRVLELIAAIAGYNIPLTFYIDADHKDKGIAEFLSYINNYPHIKCLVSIREEDWQLAGLTSINCEFFDFKLNFTKEEAQEIYKNWEKSNKNNFPDFEQAWVKLSPSSLLLEFVYVLNSTQTLSERLHQQYNQIVDEVSCGKRSEYDLLLLEYISVVGACGARIDLSKLKIESKISPHLLKRSIERLENEYLLRSSDDARYLSALHPIRSKVLLPIVSDPSIRSWEDIAIECLPILSDSDIEIFLLDSFISYPNNTNKVLDTLNIINFSSWTALGAIVRALLWKGIYNYRQNNKKLYNKLYLEYGSSYFTFLDLDFIGILKSTDIGEFGVLGIIENLENTNSVKIQKSKNQIKQWRQEQTAKDQAFQPLESWLKSYHFTGLNICTVDTDWQALGQTIFWVNFRKIEINFFATFNWDDLNPAITKASLDKLGDLIYGIWQNFSTTEDFLSWYNIAKPKILNRYKKEKTCPYIEEIDSVICTHFFIPWENSGSSSAHTYLNNLTMEHITLLYKLFPNYITYSSRGYGYKPPNILEADETYKNIKDKFYLTPTWVKNINSINSKLDSHLFRPKTWENYCNKVVKIREKIIYSMDKLREQLIQHFRSKKITTSLIVILESNEWVQLGDTLKKFPNFPLEAIDELGFVAEYNFQNEQFSEQQKFIFDYLNTYKPYIKSQQDYINNLKNFMANMTAILINNIFSGKKLNSKQKLGIKRCIKLLNIDNNNPFLAVNCLANAITELHQFQKLYYQHFINFSNKQNLIDLEKKETELLNAVWYLWFFFTTEPQHYYNHPQNEFNKKFTIHKQNIKNKLYDFLQQLSTSNTKCKCLSDQILFDNKSTFWINIDGDNPLEVSQKNEQLITQLQEIFKQIKFNSLEYYATKLQWEYFLILCTIKGKLLVSEAQVIPKIQFTEKFSQSISSVSLDNSILLSLNLKLHKHELLRDAKLFLHSFFLLKKEVQHLSEINQLPELDEIGRSTMQTYVNNYQDGLNKNLIKLINSINTFFKLIKYIEEIKKTNNDTFEYLSLAKSIISKLELIDILKLQTITTPENLSPKKLNDWYKRLESIENDIGNIYLLWCGYLINSSEIS